MVDYGLGRPPAVVYAMVSGTGTKSANLKVNNSDGQWIPLQTTPDGKLETSANFVLSGTEIIVNLNHDSDNVLIYGNDGTTDRKILTDSNGRVETNSIVSGSISVDLSYVDDSILVYGSSDGGTTKQAIKTDTGGAVQVDIENTHWDAVEDFPIRTSGTVILFHASDGQIDAMDDGDAVRPVTTLYGEQVNAGYTWASTSNRTEEVNPLSEQYIEEEETDTTGVSAATNYYPSSTGLSMGGSKNLSIGFVVSGTVVMTVEATNDDASSPDWIDITRAGTELSQFSTDNVNFQGRGGILQYTSLNVKKVRIKSITADTNNAVQYHIRKTAL